MRLTVFAVKGFTCRLHFCWAGEVKSISPVVDDGTLYCVNKKSRAISIEKHGVGPFRISVGSEPIFDFAL